MKGQTMRNIAFNKIGKIVAIASGIVLMGAVFSGCSLLFEPIAIAESCNGNGIVTTQSSVKGGYKDEGECKKRKKEGIWKTYDSNDRIIQETNYVGGILNGITKIYGFTRGFADSKQFVARQIEYVDGKAVKESAYEYGQTFYQYEKNDNRLKRYRKYDIVQFLAQDRAIYDKKVQPLKDKNAQIEQENRQMQWEAEQKVAEAKQKAIEIAKQRAQSKVKKPTMQEVAKSKGVMDAYREKLKAQEEKELQIELAKIQMPQTTKQSLSIPPYQEPKLDTIDEVLSYIKDKKYTFEEHIDYSKKTLCPNHCSIVSSQDSDGKNFRSNIKGFIFISTHYNDGRYDCKIENDKFSKDGCWKLKSDSTFRILLKDSMFKDKINAILPNK